MDVRLKRILKDIFNLSDKEFTAHMTKDDVSNWDSLKHMDLITTLEKEYAVEIEMLEIITMLTFDDVVNTLRSKGVEFEK